MTTEQLADILFTLLQDEMSESIKEPWASKHGDVFKPNFDHTRNGNTLLVVDFRTREAFEITISPLVRP